MSKIFERIVYDQVYAHFINQSFLFNSQYGFRKDHSTEFATLELINRLFEFLDNGSNPLAVFLDLSKAFDTINHNILLQKLHKYGFSNIELNWFRSYLSNRLQYVSFDNLSSNMSKISTGVPQGSILGPLLFIIYVNDLHSITNMNVIMYADDTSLLNPLNSNSNSSNNANFVNEQLSKIFLWLNANKLSLNVNKSKCMLFHYKQKQIADYPYIHINGKPLSFVKHFKCLGIYIDDTLSWDHHINYIGNKLSRVNGILSKLKHFFPKNILTMIYNSLFLSHLNYGITCWGFGVCNRLEVLQKCAVRNINKSPIRSHSLPVFKSLNMLTFNDIFDLACLKFFHKHQNNQTPKYFLKDKFIQRYHPIRNDLRNTTPAIFTDYVIETVNYRPTFYIPKLKRKFSENRLSIRIVKLINNNYFPSCVTEKITSHSISGFSNYFKQYVINKYDATCHIANCFICQNL